MEEWRQINGYEGLYEISNMGRVLILGRHRFDGRNYKTKIAKNSLLTTGYLNVGLYKNGKRQRYSIHRLVAEAFIPNPKHLPQVNHKDGNRTNNAVDNLEWVTVSDNALHSFRELDRKVWNKGNHKLRIRICSECGDEFDAKRNAQILCSQRCVARRGQRGMKKSLYLKENNLLSQKEKEE